MDPPTKNDPFTDRSFVEDGYQSPDSEPNSESSSSSSSSSSGSPDSAFSPTSSDSEASGAPMRDATKKLFKDLYNSCKESDLLAVAAVMPEVKHLAKSMRSTSLLNQPNIKDRFRRTPLLASIEGGNLDLIKMLLESGGDPKRETKAPDSCNAMMLAFRYGHTAIAEYLLDHEYFELENSDNIFNYTLLHQAVSGQVQCVKMLISKGADVNASSAFQVTPLHSAVSAGNPQVVSELILSGAMPNATDKFGRTPLYLACNSFNLPIVKILVEEGKCDVNITDNNHNSAFDIADKKNLRETCRYLLQHGAIPRSIKENATGLGTLRFFRPYIAAGSGHPDLLPTARTKAGLCAVGTKVYLNGGVGLKMIQSRPDEALFNHPNLLSDLFVLDLNDRKMQAMVSPADIQVLMSWCADTSQEFHLSHHSLNVPDIVVTPSTPPPTPLGPTPLVMSRTLRSERVKVSKDGLTVQAMPAGYKSGTKKLGGARVTAATAMMASYQPEPQFVACVKATAPYEREKTPIAYWEMTVLEATEKVMTIGFTHEDFPLNRYHPGWCLDSYAYHNDDGSCFHVKAPIPDHGLQWGPRFTTGDVVGAGINFQTNEVFFTKNGKFLGVAYRGVTGNAFYATISFGSVGAKAKVNCGRKPFKFSFAVPTLSWTKLGHTSYSPLAFVPHPDGQGKFIHISYGDAAAMEGLVSQRGNMWHCPKVCIVDTNPSSSEGSSFSWVELTEHFVPSPYIRRIPTVEEKERRKKERDRESTKTAAPASGTPTTATGADLDHKMQQPLQNPQQHDSSPRSSSISGTSATGPSAPSIPSQTSGTSANTTSTSFVHTHVHTHSAQTHGQAAQSLSTASAPTTPTLGRSTASPMKSTAGTTNPASSSSQSTGTPHTSQGPGTIPQQHQGSTHPSGVSSVPASPIVLPKPQKSSVMRALADQDRQQQLQRRPSKPYKRVNRYADSSDSESNSDVSSILSSQAALEDSNEDPNEAAFDESIPYDPKYASVLSRLKVSLSQMSLDSMDADSTEGGHGRGGSFSDDEDDASSIFSDDSGSAFSSGGEADEEDDEGDSRAMEREAKRAKRRITPSQVALQQKRSGRPVGGAEHSYHAHSHNPLLEQSKKKSFNRNAPASPGGSSLLLPTDFYLPECDYQVHHTKDAVYLFAPADEEEVQLLKLNVTLTTPSAAQPTTPHGQAHGFKDSISSTRARSLSGSLSGLGGSGSNSSGSLPSFHSTSNPSLNTAALLAQQTAPGASSTATGQVEVVTHPRLEHLSKHIDPTSFSSAGTPGSQTPTTTSSSDNSMNGLPHQGSADLLGVTVTGLPAHFPTPGSSPGPSSPVSAPVAPVFSTQSNTGSSQGQSAASVAGSQASFSGSASSLPPAPAAAAAAQPHFLSAYSYTWSDLLAEYPALKRDLSRLQEPRTALIQGHLYFFSSSLMYKLDTQTMKWETKVLSGLGPRGSNFVATVIQPDAKPLLEGEAHVLCFGGVVGNIAQSNVYTLDVVAGEWDVPHLSGVNPRPRVEQGGLVYIAGEQNIVVIQGGWNGKNYIDDLDFLHLEAPEAPDPLERAINSQALSDFTIWDSQETIIPQPTQSTEAPTKTSPNKASSGGLTRISISSVPGGAAGSHAAPFHMPTVGEERDSIGAVTTSSAPSISLSAPKIDSSAIPAGKTIRKCILVNKIILAMRSTFFKTLFEVEPQRKEYTLECGASGHSDFALFSAFIKYLYTDSIVPDLIDDTNAAAFIGLFTTYAPKHRERVLEELVITRPAIKSTMDENLALAFNNPLFSDVQLLIQYKEEATVTIYGHRAILCTRNEVFNTMFLGGSSSSSSSSTSSSNQPTSSATPGPQSSSSKDSSTSAPSATATSTSTTSATPTVPTSTTSVPASTTVVASSTGSASTPASTTAEPSQSAPVREAIIKGFTASVFMELVRYIYTFGIDMEKVEKDENFIIDLLQAAHRYGVKGLQNMAIEIITAKFSLANVCSILVLADQLNIKKLIKAAASFVRTNYEPLAKQSDFHTNQAVIQKALETFFPQ